MIQTLLDDLNENSINELIYSNYGLYPAFCYRGTNKFINKITNLIVNYSILGRGEFYKLHSGIEYILVPEDRILAGIRNCIRNEVIMNYELYPEIKFNCKLVEKDEKEPEMILTWDESMVEQLVNEQTAKFWVEKVKKINLFQYYKNEDENDEFGIGEMESIREPNE